MMRSRAGAMGPAQERRRGAGLKRTKALGRTLRFSQRLSGDHLVLDLRENECGFHDVAYLGRADGDVLEGAPAFLQKGEAAFALVAEAAEEHAAAFRVSIEVTFTGLSHRDEHSGAGAL